MILPRRRLLGLAAAAGAAAGCSAGPPEPAASSAPPDSPATAASTPTAPGPPSASSPNAPESASPTPAATGLGDPTAEEVVTGLRSPWGLIPLRDGSFLVSERDTAEIVLVADGRSRRVGTVGDAEPYVEGGLLGIAASADQETLFAYFTAADDNRIVRMRWDGRRIGDQQVVLSGIPKGARHNGGRMIIGPDDLLYVSTGETGDPDLAQDRDSPAGKILRITPDGDPAPGNPFGNEVFSYGHRNVQGLVFDPQGRLWASEFGDQQTDELNLIEAGGNYGWPEVEGAGGADGMIDPVVEWSPAEASPSGLTFWKGSFYLAALRGERLWEVPLTDPDAGRVGEPRAHFTGEYGRLRSVEVSADGEALLVLTNNTDGRTRPRDGDDRLLRITR